MLGAQLTQDGRLRSFVTPHLFAQAREAAEKRARATKVEQGAFPEVTLDEVYAALPDEMLTVDRSVLIEAELAVEEALVFADDGVVDLLTSVRGSGLPVVFVSETYLTAAQVGRLLRAAGVDVEPESIFTSTDHGCGKASGLFDVVLDRIGVDQRPGCCTWATTKVPTSRRRSPEGCRRSTVRCARRRSTTCSVGSTKRSKAGVPSKQVSSSRTMGG